MRKGELRMPSFTKRAIMESCMKLLAEKPVNRIYVKDIVEDCGINRNTFYYHFEDMPALIEEIIRDEADKIIAEYDTVDSLTHCLKIAADFALKNRRAAMHVFDSPHRELYEKSLMSVCGHVVETYIDSLIEGRPISPRDRRIIIASYRNEFYGTIADWMSQGMKDEATDDFLRLCELKYGVAEEMISRSLGQQGRS